jgi:hypothetical protein
VTAPLYKRDRLGPAGHQYSTRWTLRVPFTNLTIRLHHWYGSDDTRAYHSHPQWFATLVLWGGYRDVTPVSPYGPQPAGLPQRSDWLGPLSFRVRRADYQHYVVPTSKHAWTLLLFGGPKQRWDFYRVADRKRFRRDKWFAEAGHHTQDGSPAVRMRPNGSVING